ncbi:MULTISPECIES: TetR/AcrR family transcriptional regulator [Roseivirga]|jgi:AcrR family transcriptional regulator|uniref:TetR family transcriptional regulator n=1 Tax=Roseivirga thermotolerans TaxID=1758176 RepID=A0ABQ3I774_9BACT|nr:MULTISPECIES: TetR/AcrR family transcriptional regulator [Roseivirga]MEC7754060.1 TetR/AcrR family transcriptional regulator [Bacteroidota bacterium]GHE61021.1 TetR family transcriptional regulator [Roseivirga thermotolerans]|tara:strand:- start:13576 stop:14256 length:681 start_codon:yes stop_codon:yes gene_type:complete
MATLLKLQMNECLYLKDPQDTELGRKIVQQSIQMIDELGLEAFTFKKLSLVIDSTEASIYRYFENKHKLLVYLITWYWTWLEYKIEFETNNVADPYLRLSKALRLVTEKKTYDNSFPDVDETALQRIVINEFDKTYLTKQVDHDNSFGLFRGVKSLCGRIADIVKEINPDYPYAHSLISTCLQAAHQQVFFSEHLPSLTDHSGANDKVYTQNYEFIHQLVLKAIQE